jgi:hydroxyacyl-ACP dehydratase HTD2-like protein with hotdog domain
LEEEFGIWGGFTRRERVYIRNGNLQRHGHEPSTPSFRGFWYYARRIHQGGSVNELTETVIGEIESLHLLRCRVSDVKRCTRHSTLILGLKNHELVLENQIRAQLTQELQEARDFMVLTKKPESDTAAMWITYAFDRAIGFLGGKNERS